MKSEIEREEKRKREKEKDKKIGEIGEIRPIREEKESGRTASALSVLLPYKLFKVPVPVLIVIDILGYLKVVRLPPIQEIGILF